MASTTDFKNGMCIVYNNVLFTIVSFQHVKPGKGPAFVRTKLKNIKTGKVIDNTFNSGVKIETARIERRPYQYLFLSVHPRYRVRFYLRNKTAWFKHLYSHYVRSVSCSKL